MNKPQFEVRTLDNGLVVALEHNPFLDAISGQLRVFAGSGTESANEYGLAHFLEHTLINAGSKRFSAPSFQEARKLFGNFNANTNKERVAFVASAFPEYLTTWLEIISDCIFNPGFEEKYVGRERERVLREITTKDGAADYDDIKNMRETLFGSDSAFSRENLGLAEVVKSANVEVLRSFHSCRYYTNNADLILVGPLPEDISDIIDASFSESRRGKNYKNCLPRPRPLSKKTIIHSSAPDLISSSDENNSNAYLKICLQAPGKQDDDMYSFAILATLLGDSKDSRIFRKVSREMGLAYKIGANYIIQSNNGALFINGSVQAKRAQEAIDLIFDEFIKLRTEPVSQEELNETNLQVRYQIAALDSNGFGRIGYIETFLDQGKTVEDALQRFKAVTPEDVMRCAQKYLPVSRNDNNYVLLLRDPLKKQ